MARYEPSTPTGRSALLRSLLLVALLGGCQNPDEPGTTPSDGTTPPPTGTADTGPTRPVPVVLTASARPHGIHLAVDRAPGPSRLVCEAPSVPAERHEAIDPFDGAGRFTLLGLLADTAYDCRLIQPADATEAEADQVSTASTVTTPRLAIDTPWSIAEHDPNARSGHYTLFNLGDGESNVEPHQLIIVDPEGRVRWVHLIPDEFPDCDARYQFDGTVLYGGGQGIPPTIVTLAGDKVWEAPEAPFAERYHHHAERLDDGTILTLRHTIETPPIGEGQPKQDWQGFRVERLAPDGMPHWSWTSQRGVDEGWLPVPHPSADDPWHANSVHVDRRGVTYVNLRQASWLLAIDDTGQLLWRLGQGGDFELRDAEGRPLADEHWFHGAHDPQFHEGPDGTIRILFHDNGYRRGVSPAYSQILELVVDETTRVATRSWAWTEPGWYEPIWGDADELADGGVLVTRGHCASCPEPDVSELMEVDRTTGRVDWRLRFDGPRWGVYRAQRLDGCDLFHHTAACPVD